MAGISEYANRDFSPSAGTVSVEYMRDVIVITAHDLRNPLACVVSTLELLEAKAPEGRKSDVNAIVSRGLRAAERIDGMLQRLLDRARPENDTLTCPKSKCSLRQVVKSAVEQNILAAQRKSISINIVGPDVRVVVDDSLLVEAIDNLINNAIKYSHRDTEITCDVGQEFGSAFVRIADQGEGLTQDDLEQMGRPYQKLSATPTGGERSMGLGLWAVRRIAESLGGELRAESDGPQQGATFTLRLPEPADLPKLSNPQYTSPRNEPKGKALSSEANASGTQFDAEEYGLSAGRGHDSMPHQ